VPGCRPPRPRGEDDAIRHTVQRLESAPNQWAIGGTIRNAASFAEPTGANALQAALEALKSNPNAQLPVELS
jgi:hypothetical protein